MWSLLSYTRGIPCTPGVSSKSRMGKLNVGLLCIADAWMCSVSTAPLRAKHSDAALEPSAPETFPKVEIVGHFYGALVCYDLSSREHARNLYRNVVLKVDMERFSRYERQVQTQGDGLGGSLGDLETRTLRVWSPLLFVHVVLSTTSATPKKARSTASTDSVYRRGFARQMASSGKTKYIQGVICSSRLKSFG